MGEPLWRSHGRVHDVREGQDSHGRQLPHGRRPALGRDIRPGHRDHRSGGRPEGSRRGHRDLQGLLQRRHRGGCLLLGGRLRHVRVGRLPEERMDLREHRHDPRHGRGGPSGAPRNRRGPPHPPQEAGDVLQHGVRLRQVPLRGAVGHARMVRRMLRHHEGCDGSLQDPQRVLRALVQVPQAGLCVLQDR